MKFKNEKQIMKSLGIDNWRNLSKDKVIKFAAMMPDMDKEVMFKIIEQFPEFTKFAGSIVESFEEAIQNLSEANSSDYSIVIDALKETQDIIKGELQKPEITPEERKYLIENLMKVAEMFKELDSNNKKFLKGLSNDNLKLGVLAVLAAVVALGGKVLINQLGNNSDDSIEIDYTEVD